MRYQNLKDAGDTDNQIACNYNNMMYKIKM